MRTARRMITWGALAGLAVAGAAGVTGCATGGAEGGGLPEVQGGVELGLKRGAAWSTLKVRPPYVIGPRVNLRLNRGVFTGTIDGRPVNLRIDERGISGTGPMGQVAIDIAAGEAEMVIEGMWNGSRTHFQMNTESVKGTIAVYQSTRLTDVFSCQYVLDRVLPDGSRAGNSTCAGLPEDTVLEVPPRVQAWLTRAELTVVLLALLSSPPYTAMERTFPY